MNKNSDCHLIVFNIYYYSITSQTIIYRADIECLTQKRITSSLYSCLTLTICDNQASFATNGNNIIILMA